MGLSAENFLRIGKVLRFGLTQFVPHWLPDGRREGSEWVARNPTRNDRTPGSFRINLHTGKWADFATGDKGGDAISLYAYLKGYTQTEAALELSETWGL